MTERKAVLFKKDFIKVERLVRYTDEELGKMLRCFLLNVNGKEDELEERELSEKVAELLDYDYEYGEVPYLAQIERNRKNGEKGGRPPKKPAETHQNPENPVDLEETQKTKINEKKIKEKKIKEDDSISSKDDMSVFTDEVVLQFNTICSSYPPIRRTTDRRRGFIKARFQEGYTMDDFIQVFQNMEQSTFLKGGNKKDFRATFDWVIRPNNFVKVLEGNYNDRNNKRRDSSGSKMDDLRELYEQYKQVEEDEEIGNDNLFSLTI